MKKITSMILALVFAVSLIGSASAKTLKIQLTFPKTSYDGQIVKMWTDRVTKLTRGELKFELLSKGEVVGMKETLEAVDKGLVDGGAAWTHYWSNYHPAAMLFGSPVAGGGIGLSTKSWLAWYFDNGGKALYDRMWDEMGMNVKGFVMASSGPEALGWFKEPINSMADLENTDSELLREFLDKLTKTLVLHQFLCQVVIYYQHLKKEQSMLQNGVVQNLTLFSVFRKFLKTITYKVYTKTL